MTVQNATNQLKSHDGSKPGWRTCDWFYTEGLDLDLDHQTL